MAARHAGLAGTVNSDASLRTCPPQIQTIKSTDGTGSSDWGEVLLGWFIFEEEEHIVRPRIAGKPNWMLVLTVASMAITLCSLLFAGIWTLSSKNTDLDSIQRQTTANTLAIAAMQQKIVDNNNSQTRALSDFQQLYIRDVTTLQQQQKEILDRIQELKTVR